MTIIVPSYNEARTLNTVLRRLVALPISKEIIVVDDGSTDMTQQLLSTWKAQREVSVLRHAANRGKGTAIRTGLNAARGEFVIIQDADLEVVPEVIPQLIAPLVSGDADFVIGNRFAKSQRHRTLNGALTQLGIKLLNWVFWLLYRQSVSDEASCYKALATERMKSMALACERFEFCPEVLAKAARLNLRFTEVAIEYIPRSRAEGKKLRLTDGISALQALWKFRHWRPAETSSRVQSTPQPPFVEPQAASP